MPSDSFAPFRSSILANAFKYGGSFALLSYLVFTLANSIPVLQAQSETTLSQHQAMKETIVEIKKEQEENSSNSLKMLRSICLILASSQQEKQLCNP